MDIPSVSPQATAGVGGGGGFGWNPLTDFAKATTGIGSWIDAHTSIGSFNPGIGAFASSAANMFPGLLNSGYQIGRDVLTGREGDALHVAGQVGTGLLHGAEDTLTDVATLGGVAPWTNQLEQGISTLPGGYKPSSLYQYATSKGQGLGGAVFNDVANLSMVADGAGALAKSGALGEAAEGARLAEETAKIGAVDERLSTPDVEKAGAEARAQHLVDRVPDGVDPYRYIKQVEDRAKTIDRIQNLRTQAGNLLQPWHALHPFALEAGRQLGTNAEAPSEAPGGPEAPPGTLGAETAPNAVEGHTEASERTFTAGAGEPAPPKPGYTRLYHGSDMEEAPGQAGAWWSTVKPEGRNGYGNWQYTDVPTQSVERKLATAQADAQLDAQQGGEGGTPRPGKDVIFDVNHPAQRGWMDDAKPYTPAGVREGVVLTEAPPAPDPAGATPSSTETAAGKASGVSHWLSTNGQYENVPEAYRSYLEQATPAPRWVRNVVDKVPQPMLQLLQWMDAHSKRIAYQKMTRQQIRAIAISAREIENRPEVQALFKQAADIVRTRFGEDKVSPTVASNIVGQIVRAVITRGPQLVEDLENHRAATIEHWGDLDPQSGLAKGSLLIDSQLGYSVHIPDELNTPEWRAEMYKLIEPYRQMRVAASADFFNDAFHGDKGAQPDHVVLTKKEQANFDKAMQKLQVAAGMEKDVIPKQLAGLAKDLAFAKDEVGAAITRSQAAMEDMVNARDDFDRSRYVPPSIDTEEKLAAVADETARRTIEGGGGTYDPHAGKFRTFTDAEDAGYLVGALADSPVKVPLADFQRINPDTGRMIGAEMVEHFAHGYQEALAYPGMSIGTWVDDDGNVRIDPTQFLAGQESRDRALTLASVREQKTVKELHTGSDIEVQLDPNNSAYFLDKHEARDARGNLLRNLMDQQAAKGGAGLDQDGIDRHMAFMDQLAVQQFLLHPDQYKSADDFYRKGWSLKPTIADRSAAGGLNEVRLLLSGRDQILRIVKPLMADISRENAWYFKNHDYIEKVGDQLPDVDLGLGTPWSDGRTVKGKELLYSLVAIMSVNAAPSDDMASAVAVFKNMSGRDVKRVAQFVQDWINRPQDERTPRSGKLTDEKVNIGTAGNPRWVVMPQLLQELLPGGNQVARRQALAVLDGHTLDRWDAKFLRDTWPNYGNVEGPKLDVSNVTDAERAALPGQFGATSQAAIMEHYGSNAQAKLRSFWENLNDPENSMSVTLDSHMARAFGHADTFWAGDNWFKHAEMIRGVARDLSGELGRKVMPHEVQAALWYWVKTKYASVQTAAQRANIADALNMIDGGTWTRDADPNKLFYDSVVKEAMTLREGELVEKRPMRFVDEPFSQVEGKGKKRTITTPEGAPTPVEREIDWRQLNAKVDKDTGETVATADGKKMLNAAGDWNKVLDTVEGHVAAGDKEAAKQAMLDWMTKREGELARKVKGENFWDMEKKPIIRAMGDELGITLPGDQMVQNEFRDELMGQFLPSNKTAGGLIRLFRNADFGTLMHESGHLLRALTTGDALAELERAYGVRDHRWTSDQEEAFVHDFLASASEGTTGPMSRLRGTLADAYGEFGENQHPEIDSFWQKTLRPTIPAPATGVTGFTLSTGEKIRGLEGGPTEAGRTMGQRQAMKTKMEGTETQLQQYRRGAKGEASINDWMAAAKRKRAADAAGERAQDYVAKLEKAIAERDVPVNKDIALLKDQADRTMAKLYDKLDNPPIGRVPARWQPMVVAAKELAAQIEAHPELEEVLGDFPKTFGDALDYAQEHGMDPTYMPDLTPQRVTQLIAGTSTLGGSGRDAGKMFTSGARKQRNAVLQRVGGADTSIEALVAGLNQQVQEARTNMVVDWIDRVAARDIPSNGIGQRYKTPSGWVEWDPIRRGMLATDAPGEPGERIQIGATKMVPRAVAQAIKEYAGDPPTNPIYRAMKKLTDPWRALMLTLSPGFYLKHFQGHLMLAAIAGGLDLKAWSEAWHAARTGFRDLPEVTGQNIAFTEGRTPGLVTYGSYKDARQIGGQIEGAHYLADKAHGVIATTDSFARAVAYFSKRHKGWTPLEAAQYAMDAVIDYGNLSNTEKYWVRAIVPFYSFEKGVAKLIYHMPMDHPLAASLLLSLSRWQQDQAVDSNGNPLPERYQGVVDLPLLGNVDMQKFSPFKDLAALTTPEGLMQSLQYAVQATVRAATGNPAPGTRAKVKVDQYGRLVPGVSLPSQLASSFLGSPQGQLIQGGSPTHFLGIPTVSQATLDKAGARNVLSEGELANATTTQQQKAASSPVDSIALQQNLRQQIAAGATPSLPTSPTGGQMFSAQQLQDAVNNAVSAQQAKAKLTKASNPKSTRRSGRHSRRTRHRLRQGFAKVKTFK